MEYIVACGNHKFFAYFQGGAPAFTAKRGFAKRFDSPETAEHIAKRCHKITGRTFKVVEIEVDE